MTDENEMLGSSIDEPSNGATAETSGETLESQAVVSVSAPRRRRDKPYLDIVASQPCLVCDRAPCEANHCRFAQPRTISIKEINEWNVPLCATLKQFLLGAGYEWNWRANKNIDPIVSAEQLRRAARDILAAE